MKRDQFARDLRKIVKPTLTSEDIFLLYPLFIESGLKVYSFAVSQGMELKAIVPKRYESLQPKKGTKPAAKYSKKREKIEREYEKVKAKKYEQFTGCCDGCGASGCYIDCSRRLPRDPYTWLISDIDNLDWYCRKCHENVELGYYDELLNGETVKNYIKMQDLVFFNSKYKPTK